MRPIYKITYDGTAFGDNLFTAWITNTLQNNGFDARLFNPRIANLVNCPMFSQTSDTGVRKVEEFNCRRQNRTGLQTNKSFTVYTDLLNAFSEQFGIRDDLRSDLDHIPVQFTIDSSVPNYDIAIVSETGWWTPYRNWPHFGELKNMLSASCISFCDISSEGARGNIALNIVRNSKLYLGLETGISHYVSKFANGKALILQSGYSPFEYWAGAYDYQCLSIPVSCSPCWKRSGCPGHECMSQLHASIVFESILEVLKR